MRRPPPPEDGRAPEWKPGESPNPGGLPGSKWVREFMSEHAPTFKKGMTRKKAVLQALYQTAVDREHRDHGKACELLLAYTAAKPPQAAMQVELKGGVMAVLEALKGKISDRAYAEIWDGIIELGRTGVDRPPTGDPEPPAS